MKFISNRLTKSKDIDEKLLKENVFSESRLTLKIRVFLFLAIS
jgi:predicted HTH domain antitoxin